MRRLGHLIALIRGSNRVSGSSGTPGSLGRDRGVDGSDLGTGLLDVHHAGVRGETGPENGVRIDDHRLRVRVGVERQLELAARRGRAVRARGSRRNAQRRRLGLSRRSGGLARLARLPRGGKRLRGGGVERVCEIGHHGATHGEEDGVDEGVGERVEGGAKRGALRGHGGGGAVSSASGSTSIGPIGAGRVLQRPGGLMGKTGPAAKRASRPDARHPSVPSRARR